LRRGIINKGILVKDTITKPTQQAANNKTKIMSLQEREAPIFSFPFSWESASKGFFAALSSHMMYFFHKISYNTRHRRNKNATAYGRRDLYGIKSEIAKEYSANIFPQLQSNYPQKQTTSYTTK
jgi:hypothetical protein